MEKTAIILAGGLGTRLRPVVNDVPKSMAPINGLPFLHYLLLHLQKKSVKHVILSVGYKHEYIQASLGNEFLDISLDYVIEEEPLGTGGALVLAAQNLQEDFFLLNGDTLAQVSLVGLSTFHRQHSADITLSLSEMNQQTRYGTVVLNQHRVTGFQRKQVQPISGLINAGTYCFSRSALDYMPAALSAFSLEQFLETSLNRLTVCGWNNTRYFIDIGIPEDFQRAQLEFINQFPTRHQSEQPLIKATR